VSFLLGKNEQVSNVNKETEALFKQLSQYLSSGQGLDRLFPGSKVDNEQMQPYLDLFTQQNSRNLAQAKESAGNLTGSGLGNIIGAEAGRASTEQGAFLANLFETRRTGDANRFLQTLLGAGGSPANSVSNVYTPGFLDYASEAASSLAGGGAFNSFLNPGKKPASAVPVRTGGFNG
jgi:hypothetical protein